MSPPATVFVVDDDPSVLRLISKIVETIGLTPETYSSPDEFLEKHQRNGPACLVLDVMMPGMSGLSLMERLAESRMRLPIIVISAYADVRLAVQAMRSGALTFLEKPFRVQELCESIQEAVRIDQEQWRRREDEAKANQSLSQLDERDREIVSGVAAGKTNQMIAKELGISIRTVENRRARIKKKLDVGSRTELMALMNSAQIVAVPR